MIGAIYSSCVAWLFNSLLLASLSPLTWNLTHDEFANRIPLIMHPKVADPGVHAWWFSTHKLAIPRHVLHRLTLVSTSSWVLFMCMYHMC